MKYDVFISYRRDGGDTLAQLIYDRLTTKGYKVFLDIESLRSGKFNEKLLEVIDDCKDVVVILPPNAIDRCMNEGDWLYTEMHQALKREKNIVPVMMKGFTWPEKMPAGLEELPNFNGIQDSKDYFDAAIDRMTALLTSKPAFRRKNTKIKVKKNTANDIWARRKKAVIAILVMTVLIAAGTGGFFYWQNQYYVNEAKYIEAVLWADDETSAKDFYNDCELLKERLDILCDGLKYSFDVNEDTVKVKMPREVLPEGMEIEALINIYISRPTNLTLYAFGINRIDIERTDIVELIAQDGVDSCVDLSKIYFDEEKDAESIRTFRITFTDEINKRIESELEDTGEIRLVQDMGTNTGWYDYALFSNGSDNCYYFVVKNLNSDLERLLLHNYTTEAYSNVFRYDYKAPVTWERKRNAGIWGENQEEARKLSDDTITAYYEISDSDSMGEGTYNDQIAQMKSKLDSLGLSYSFGFYNGGTDRIAVKLPRKNIGIAFLKSLFAPHLIKIESANGAMSSITEAKCITLDENGDGTYYICVEFEGWRADELAAYSAEATVEKPVKFYLTLSNEAISIYECTSQITDGKIDFDNLIPYGMDTMPEEYKHYYTFIADGKNELIESAYYQDVYAGDRENWDLYDQYTIDKGGELEREILEKFPNAETEYNFLSGNIYLNYEDNELDATTLNQAIKDVLQITRLADEDYGVFTIYFFKCESILNASASVHTENDIHSEVKRTLSVRLVDGRLNGIIDELKEIVEKDTFYNQFSPTYGSESVWIFE